jgi:hypothetical protein
MLNDEGNEFAKNYFDFDTGLFPQDYEETFPEIETIYHVEDTWENYNKIKNVIDIWNGLINDQSWFRE